MRRLLWVLWLMAVLSAFGGVGLAWMVQPTDTLTPETVLLTDMNARRLRENLVHLVPNPALNDVAAQYVNALASRPVEQLGDVFTVPGGGLSDLTEAAGYQPYPDGMVVDVVPTVLRDVPPTAFLEYWVNDARSASPQIASLRRLQGTETFLPLFSARYREVGIAYRFDAASQRHYYALVFGAQPNVLPVVAVERDALPVIANQVPTGNVVLYLHNERVNRFGAEGVIGNVQFIRVSEGEAGELPCPTAPDAAWVPYQNELPFTLSAGDGRKTVYVQFCDEAGRSVQSQVGVTVGATPVTEASEPAAPDVLAIANATQTAAASATAYAPYAATVDAILTATATGP